MPVLNKLVYLIELLVVASVVPVGSAHATGGVVRPPPSPFQDRGMMRQETRFGLPGRNSSMQMMVATVTAVDADTGLVNVTAEGMALKVHFPPESVADLKSGDVIRLHMSFNEK